MEEKVIFVRFVHDVYGEYYLPAREISSVVNPLRGQWVQYIVPYCGPMNEDVVKELCLDEVNQMNCKLLPLTELVDAKDIYDGFATVSYSIHQIRSSNLYCDGMYTGNGKYLPLKEECGTFGKCLKLGMRMDANIFKGEEHKLRVWTEETKRTKEYIKSFFN